MAIVDDQHIFRQSLGLLISSVPGFELVAEAAGGPEYLEILNTLPRLPHVTLLDMSMPGMNGIELNSILQEKYPEVKIVILSVNLQDRLISKMITEGADAYLVKNCDKDELITAIQAVYKAGFYINLQTMQALQHYSDSKSRQHQYLNATATDITRREKEVLEMICKELSAAEIASKLYLSVRTVEGHRNNLILKTGARNTAGLVIFAVKSGLYNVGI